MKLFIDTSDSEKVVVALDGERFEADARKEKSQKLLPFIDKLLSDKGKTLKDLTEIEVNTGPGSYTGLRVGVSVANALGWSLQIPVNGKKISQNFVTKIKYDSDK